MPPARPGLRERFAEKNDFAFHKTTRKCTKKRIRLHTLSIATLAFLCSAAALADTPPAIDKSGTATGPAFTIPYSSYASPEAAAMFQQVLADGKKTPSLTLGIEPSRTFYDKINSDRANRMQKIYPVTTHPEIIGGVPTEARPYTLALCRPASAGASQRSHKPLTGKPP